MKDVLIKKAEPTAEILMAMNRKERRRVGKLNGIKIPPSNVPKVNLKKR